MRRRLMLKIRLFRGRKNFWLRTCKIDWKHKKSWGFSYIFGESLLSVFIFCAQKMHIVRLAIHGVRIHAFSGLFFTRTLNSR